MKKSFGATLVTLIPHPRARLGDRLTGTSPAAPGVVSAATTPVAAGPRLDIKEFRFSQRR